MRAGGGAGGGGPLDNAMLNFAQFLHLLPAPPRIGESRVRHPRLSLRRRRREIALHAPNIPHCFSLCLTITLRLPYGIPTILKVGRFVSTIRRCRYKSAAGKRTDAALLKPAGRIVLFCLCCAAKTDDRFGLVANPGVGEIQAVRPGGHQHGNIFAR